MRAAIILSYTCRTEFFTRCYLKKEWNRNTKEPNPVSRSRGYSYYIRDGPNSSRLINIVTSLYIF